MCVLRVSCISFFVECFLFFLRIRRPPRSTRTDTLFPYTTLFRSDVFLGLSAAGALKPEMVKDMAPAPIIFAMANHDPEISPPDARAARPDATITTGRPDYPNQVNNVLCFPFIFRGALDVHATAINQDMQITDAYDFAATTRHQVTEEVLTA